ncbi:hypothetical protein D9757_013367 [Collybiopsis confluens]|uniref:Uncharacterized protein n=1 Tax=Collybiopsis confluens TaxID=2823264 RepID=A0A8H5GDY2_9AGAR|nr:hypothetical protein D9757_013367 [Collybiopsis confluens]
MRFMPPTPRALLRPLKSILPRYALSPTFYSYVTIPWLFPHLLALVSNPIITNPSLSSLSTSPHPSHSLKSNIRDAFWVDAQDGWVLLGAEHDEELDGCLTSGAWFGCRWLAGWLKRTV